MLATRGSTVLLHMLVHTLEDVLKKFRQASYDAG